MFGFLKYIYEFFEGDRIKDRNDHVIERLNNGGNIKFPRVGFIFEKANIDETSSTLTLTKSYDTDLLDLDTKFNIYTKAIVFGSRYNIASHINNADNTFIIILTTDLNIKAISAPSSTGEVLLRILAINEGEEIKNGYRNISIKVQVPPYAVTDWDGTNDIVSDNLISNLFGDLDRVIRCRDIDGIGFVDIRFTVYVSYTYKDRVEAFSSTIDEVASKIMKST